MSMTEDRIIEEILAVRKNVSDDDAFTTRELTDAMGLTPPTVRGKIRLLINSGRLELTQKDVHGIDGKIYTRAAYRFLPAKELTDEGPE